MRTNAIIEKWANGETAYGTAVSLGSLRSAEICARAGFDFLIVDTLHGHFDNASATDALRAIAMTDTVPLARVAHNDLGRINDLLDAGDVLQWNSTKMSFFLISHDLAVLGKSMTDLARSVRKTAQP